MSIQDYINQLQTVKDASDQDATSQATAIAGFKAQLNTAQSVQNVDVIVSQGLQDIIDKLTALLPPPPTSFPIS